MHHVEFFFIFRTLVRFRGVHGFLCAIHAVNGRARECTQATSFARGDFRCSRSPHYDITLHNNANLYLISAQTSDDLCAKRLIKASIAHRRFCDANVAQPRFAQHRRFAQNVEHCNFRCDIYDTSVAQSGAARTIVVDVGVSQYSYPRCLQPLNVQRYSIPTNAHCQMGFAKVCDVLRRICDVANPSHAQTVARASQKNEV